jgi:hypothetical protein
VVDGYCTSALQAKSAPCTGCGRTPAWEAHAGCPAQTVHGSASHVPRARPMSGGWGIPRLRAARQQGLPTCMVAACWLHVPKLHAAKCEHSWHRTACGRNASTCGSRQLSLLPSQHGSLLVTRQKFFGLPAFAIAL